MSDDLTVVLPVGGPPPLGALPAGLRRRLLAALCAIDEQERAGVGEALPGPSAARASFALSGPPLAGPAPSPERASAAVGGVQGQALLLRPRVGHTTTFLRRSA